MPTPRFGTSDYNYMTSKPADVDGLGVMDIDADEFKTIQYTTLKGFFVKTDEDSDVSATVEFQANSKLKFANAGEFELYSDGIDLFQKGTNAAGKLRFFANSVEMLSLDPVNNSIATQGKAINKDGTASEGIYFDTSNDLVLENRIFCVNAGIALYTQNINRTGIINRGLEFDTSQVAHFMDKVIIEDPSIYALDVYGQSYFRNDIVTKSGAKIVLGGNIQTGGRYINEDGLDAKGIRFSSNEIVFYGKLRMVGTVKNIELNTGVISYDGFTQGLSFNAGNQATFDKSATFSQSVNAVTGYKFNGTNGITATINPSTTTSMTIQGGIITAFS